MLRSRAECRKGRVSLVSHSQCCAFVPSPSPNAAFRNQPSPISVVSSSHGRKRRRSRAVSPRSIPPALREQLPTCAPKPPIHPPRPPTEDFCYPRRSPPRPFEVKIRLPGGVEVVGRRGLPDDAISILSSSSSTLTDTADFETAPRRRIVREVRRQRVRKQRVRHIDADELSEHTIQLRSVSPSENRIQLRSVSPSENRIQLSSVSPSTTLFQLRSVSPGLQAYNSNPSGDGPPADVEPDEPTQGKQKKKRKKKKSPADVEPDEPTQGQKKNKKKKRKLTAPEQAASMLRAGYIVVPGGDASKPADLFWPLARPPGMPGMMDAGDVVNSGPILPLPIPPLPHADRPDS